MLIYPAIDLYGGKAVRLYKGNYDEMTVYSDDPAEIVSDFEAQGAGCMHIVDLEGAKSGETPNLETVKRLVSGCKLFTEVGGGIRELKTIEAYINAGCGRVILGTAAITQKGFAEEAAKEFPGKVAVGVDIRDGRIAIKGWTETADEDAVDFCKRMSGIGIDTVICTDISKDGAMQGTNRTLYKMLSKELDMNIIASGGVSTIDDVRYLASLGLHGAIIGKAYYTKAILLKEAIGISR